MSWIREAEERLHWANVINVMSINPAAMKAVNDLNNAITFGASALTRTQEEAIATAVSAQNECRF
jgi:alkylhydroperoxidase family enzyme